MYKIALVLSVLAIAPAWSQSEASAEGQSQYPYTLYKAYPQSPNQVDFLKKLAISAASSDSSAVFLTPIGQGKTAYILLNGNSPANYTQKFQRQHILLRKVEVSNIKRAVVDNSMHRSHELPPTQPGRQAPKEGYVISSPRVTNWGIWGDWALCNAGQKVVGMRLRAEPPQGRGDDTALNAIELLCAKQGSHEYSPLKSLEGDWGTWGKTFYCPEDAQVVGFQLRSEEYQGSGDDTAANNLRLFCNSKSGQVVDGDGQTWGDWTQPQFCLAGQTVVGFRTQVEPHQGNGDDTALNNVEMVCQDQTDKVCKAPGEECGHPSECCGDCYMGTCTQTQLGTPILGAAHPQAGSTYTVYAYSGYTLTIKGLGHDNNQPMIIWYDEGKTNQKWTLEKAYFDSINGFNVYRLKNGYGDCLTLGNDASGTENDTPVVNYPCQDATFELTNKAQLWLIADDDTGYNSYYRVYSKARRGVCLTVDGYSAGTKVVGYDCVKSGYTNGNQLWNFS